MSNEIIIIQVLQKQTGFDFIKEHKFHDSRKWRFDLANLETKTAVEIEGGIFCNGRHTRGNGYLADMEKYNAAIELGWSVLRYTPDQIWHNKTHEQIKTVCNQRK